MNRILLMTAAMVLLSGGTAVANTSTKLEIRFCPAAQVRTYPLESQRGVQSLLLQNMVVINRGAGPVDVASLDLDLTEGQDAADTRHIAGADLTRLAASGPRLQASGQMQLLSFQFCGDNLVPNGVKLAGPTLKPGEALFVSGQPFAYKGARDAVRVRVHAKSAAGDVEASASLPIVQGVSKTQFRFPLGKGRWFVAVGPTMHTGHRWGLPEEFALDIASLGDGNLSHRGAGTAFADYYAYGTDVLAAADGTVVAVGNDAPETPDVLKRPGESDESYGGRMQGAQEALITKGDAAIAGNYVLIDHGGGEYSLYAHMQPGSVRVHPGDVVRSGQPIGRLGSSGNSTEPHLHFQVCDAPQLLKCAGIPINFKGVSLPFGDYPRAIQSGDVVEVE